MNKCPDCQGATGFIPGTMCMTCEGEADTETARRADFRACPILASYLSTMLQDLQHTESDESCTEGRDERDSGTIYTLPEETYQTCKAQVMLWYDANRADIDECGLSDDMIGSTLYLSSVGHGVSFTDRGADDVLDRLEASVPLWDSAYFGDDGMVYV